MLPTTSAWLCLQHSRNLGPTFQPSPVHQAQYDSDLASFKLNVGQVLASLGLVAAGDGDEARGAAEATLDPRRCPVCGHEAVVRLEAHILFENLINPMKSHYLLTTYN